MKMQIIANQSFFPLSLFLFQFSILGFGSFLICISSIMRRCICDQQSDCENCAVPIGVLSLKLASTLVLWTTCCLKSTHPHWRCCIAKLPRAAWKRSSRSSEKTSAKRWVVAQKVKWSFSKPEGLIPDPAVNMLTCPWVSHWTSNCSGCCTIR